MTPENDGLTPDFEVVTQPSYTYKLDMQKARVKGFVDGKDAMPQAIYKILTTERYKHVIYSWDYGVELYDLIGQPIPYVYAELERRITEALTQDDRIEGVRDFQFDNNNEVVNVSFTVNTIYGTVDITNFNVEV